MPIRPENRPRYPREWPAISFRIRFDRAGGRCECEGECRRTIKGRPAHTGRCPAREGRAHPDTGSRVGLTVAHLDHTPENCAETNLKAMCQACHLAYDSEHHAETAKATRQAQRAAWMSPLFDIDPPAAPPPTRPGP